MPSVSFYDANDEDDYLSNDEYCMLDICEQKSQSQDSLVLVEDKASQHSDVQTLLLDFVEQVVDRIPPQMLETKEQLYDKTIYDKLEGHSSEVDINEENLAAYRRRKRSQKDDHDNMTRAGPSCETVHVISHKRRGPAERRMRDRTKKVVNGTDGHYPVVYAHHRRGARARSDDKAMARHWAELGGIELKECVVLLDRMSTTESASFPAVATTADASVTSRCRSTAAHNSATTRLR